MSHVNQPFIPFKNPAMRNLGVGSSLGDLLVIHYDNHSMLNSGVL